MAKLFSITTSYPSGRGAESINKEGKPAYFSYAHSSEEEAKKAMKSAKEYFKKKGLKRKLKINEVYSLVKK